MATVVKCDRCGAIIPENSQGVVYFKTSPTALKWFGHYDICDDCRSKFFDFMEELGRCDIEKIEQLVVEGGNK